MTVQWLPDQYLVEVCAADLPSVKAAVASGAHRIELCSGLAEGGVTPSVGLVQQAVKIADIPIRVLIRPRAGDFTYSPEEIESMQTDILMLCELGVEGFVLGALTSDGEVDINSMKALLIAASGKPWTFHRAFDFCLDPFKAMEEIIRLGADTILTSGQASSALEGSDLLSELVKVADHRICIMAGGGITVDNVLEVRSKTDCNTFHLSGRSEYLNHLKPSNGAALNTPKLHSDYLHKFTDPEIIRKVNAILIK
jgi:copper homeostasis protein